MIFQFVSFSALNFLASAFNYLFQYFASLRLDQYSFSHFIALVSVANFFGILSTIFRNQSALLFFESNSKLTPRLQQFFLKQKTITFFFLMIGALVGWWFKRDQFSFFQILTTAGLIFISMAAAPLTGLLQSKKEYNRIARFSLVGALFKVSAGAIFFLASGLFLQADHYLFVMAFSAFVVFSLFHKAANESKTFDEASLSSPDQAFVASAYASILGTLSIAMINSFDSILFLHVLNSGESAIYGKYVLIGKAAMVVFELIIFTLFPYFIAGKALSGKIMAGFMLVSVISFFLIDFIPLPFLNTFLSKVFMNLQFNDIWFQNYWRQIILVGLSSLLINYLMAKKKTIQLIATLFSSALITIIVSQNQVDLAQFTAANKNLMLGFFLLMTVMTFFTSRRSQ